MPKIMQTALVYLQKQLGGDFFTQWKNLSDADKTTLKRWADEEIAFLNASA